MWIFPQGLSTWVSCASLQQGWNRIVKLFTQAQGSNEGSRWSRKVRQENYGNMGRKRRPSSRSLVDTSCQLRSKTCPTIGLSCEGCWHRDTIPLYTDCLCYNNNKLGLRHGCRWPWVRPHFPHRHFFETLSQGFANHEATHWPASLCSRLSPLTALLSSLTQKPPCDLLQDNSLQICIQLSEYWSSKSHVCILKQSSLWGNGCEGWDLLTPVGSRHDQPWYIWHIGQFRKSECRNFILRVGFCNLKFFPFLTSV